MRLSFIATVGVMAGLLMTNTSNAEYVFSFEVNSAPASSATVERGDSFTVDLIATPSGSVAGRDLRFFVMTLVPDLQLKGVTLQNASQFYVNDGQGLPTEGYFSDNPTEGNTTDGGMVGSFTFLVDGAAELGTVNYTGVAFSQLADPFDAGVTQQSPLSFEITSAVPEPTSLLMFGSFLSLGLIRRRKA